jgi:tRNA(fMet)-specific endonuclease VapC
MGILIDTSIFVEQERGRIDIRRAIKQRGEAEEEAFLSAITASELFHGVHRASDPGTRAKRSAQVEHVLATFRVLSVDLACARTHARLWADLAAAGTPIGPHDLWIAATAVAHGLTLATANLREFRRVPGLQVESWSNTP